MGEMPFVRLLVAVCLLCATATCLAAQDFGPPPVDVNPDELEPVPGLPSPRQLEADHARIGSITIRTVNVFDLSIPGTNNFIYRLADTLHVRTRPAVIRAQLLFHTGQLFKEELLQESARYIRQNSSSVREPIIRPIAYHNGIVDIEVITHDVWTLNPGINFSRAGGANSWGFQVSDANFLGLGKYFEVGHSQNVDRSSTYVNWSDPNIAYTHWNDALMYARNSDGTVWGAGVSYPFFSLETPYAAGLDGGDDHSIVQRYRLGRPYDVYANDWRSADLFLGKATLINDAWTDRLMLGWRLDENQFYRAPGHALVDPLPARRDLSYPFVRLQWTRNNFVTSDNLAMIARTEDLHLGLDASLGVGFATPFFGSDRYAAVIDSELSDAWAFGHPEHKQQLFLTGRLSGRIEHASLRDAMATGYANYYLATSPNTRLYVALAGNVGHNLDGDHFFDLGGDNGLRGYPLRYQNGNQSALFTIEERLYTKWFPFKLFNVGAAAFYDMGRTWGTTLVPNPQLGLLKDVGIGLRLGNARSSFGSVIHVDLAMPLDRGYGIQRMQFLITTQQSY
jgi:hypothetical protein